MTNKLPAEWSQNTLRDSDAAWRSFGDYCVDAGPSGCAFYAPTAAEIRKNLDTVTASIRARPIAVPPRPGKSYGVADYSLLRAEIFKSSFFPYARFPPLAKALSDLAMGNATTL